VVGFKKVKNSDAALMLPIGGLGSQRFLVKADIGDTAVVGHGLSLQEAAHRFKPSSLICCL
jgi:hypothetical protein